jgi:hypothetical protein
MTNHRLVDLEPERGICKFENEVTASADVVIGADGHQGAVVNARRFRIITDADGSHGFTEWGIIPEVKPSAPFCYRMFIPSDKLMELGLGHMVKESALQFWGSTGSLPDPGAMERFCIVMPYIHRRRMICARVDGIYKPRRSSFLRRSPILTLMCETSSSTLRILNSGDCTFTRSTRTSRKGRSASSAMLRTQ